MTRKVIDRRPQEPGEVRTIKRGIGEGIGRAVTIDMNSEGDTV